MPKPAIEFIRHMHEEGTFILNNTVNLNLDELLQNKIPELVYQLEMILADN